MVYFLNSKYSKVKWKFYSVECTVMLQTSLLGEALLPWTTVTTALLNILSILFLHFLFHCTRARARTHRHTHKLSYHYLILHIPLNQYHTFHFTTLNSSLLSTEKYYCTGRILQYVIPWDLKSIIIMETCINVAVNWKPSCHCRILIPEQTVSCEVAK